MIIIDFSQLFLSSVFTQEADLYADMMNTGIVRHITLNNLLSIKKKFSKENNLDNVVLACDGQNYWRKQLFPFYKVNRKSTREKSSYNFDNIFKMMGIIKKELNDNFPYKVLQEYEAEADDIIGVLALHRCKYENIIIVSSDKDFKQLLKYKSIRQYDPYKKVLVKESDPDGFLEDMIIKGDPGDGIPNIISPDDVFVKKIRQKSITKKFLLENKGKMLNHFDNYLRNKTLIDLTEIPMYIQQNIIAQYDGYDLSHGRTKLFNYFIENHLSNLLTDIELF